MVTLRGVVARGEKAETEVDSLQSETKSEKAATNTDRFMMIELWQDFGCRVIRSRRGKHVFILLRENELGMGQA